MQMHLAKTKEELSADCARWLINFVADTLATQDRFTLVLSGGSTPKTLYTLLATENFRSQIDWGKVHFFWGDERYVPFQDERNNAKMAFDSLLDHVPIIKDQVHVMRTDIDPVESALEYDELLRRYFQGHEFTFDLVLLGLGDDAHTLSLFPGYPLVHEKIKWVDSFFYEAQEMHRITLTPPVVIQARRVAFLVSGGDKAAAVYHTIASEHDPDLYPAQIIQPFHNEAYWFCDEAAAADL